MIIAIVDFEVPAIRRAEALEALHKDAAAARQMAGNRGFRIFTNVGSRTHLGLIQEWDSQQHFQNYLASDAFAAAGAVLRPMMTAVPVSRRFEATLYEASA